jgi:hypothetical protein
MHKLFEI